VACSKSQNIVPSSRTCRTYRTYRPTSAPALQFGEQSNFAGLFPEPHGDDDALSRQPFQMLPPSSLSLLRNLFLGPFREAYIANSPTVFPASSGLGAHHRPKGTPCSVVRTHPLKKCRDARRLNQLPHRHIRSGWHDENAAVFLARTSKLRLLRASCQSAGYPRLRLEKGAFDA